MKINVLGAGIIGSATAWALAKRGADVTLIDPNPPGGLASAASFGWINASHGNPRAYYDLRLASMAAWHRLKEEHPALPFRADGTLYLHYDIDHETHFKEHSAWDYPLEWMDNAAIQKAEPNLANPPEAGLFAPLEGQLHVDGAARQFAEMFTELGGQIKHGMVQHLDLESVDMTVLAAGSASDALAHSVDIELPLTAPPGLLIYSTPLPERAVFHTLLTDGLHIQQRPDMRLVAGADFGGGAINDDPETGAKELFSRMKRAFPTLDLSYYGYTLGKRPTPSDGMPIIGRPKGRENLYITVMHSGATLAPIVAELAAQEIMTGDRDALLTPFNVDRF